MYICFDDYINIYCNINSPKNCHLLQSNIDSIYGWCTTHYIKLNTSEGNIRITLSQGEITYWSTFPSYRISIDCIKYRKILLDSKLLFNNHMNYIHVFSICTMLLVIVRSVTFSFSSHEYLYMYILHFLWLYLILNTLLMFGATLHLLMIKNSSPCSEVWNPLF
jgi:hypothetical protein